MNLIKNLHFKFFIKCTNLKTSICTKYGIIDCLKCIENTLTD